MIKSNKARFAGAAMAMGIIALSGVSIAASELPVERSGTLERSWQKDNVNFEFADGRYSGNTGCNNFSGTYAMLSETRIQIQPMVLTKKMCFDEEIMKGEAHFAQNFPGEYDIRFEGETVILLNDKQSWVFGFNDG